MKGHRVVSRDQWIEERKALLAREKEFTRLRDQLSRQRRELPWVRVDKDYVFEGANGKQTLSENIADVAGLSAAHDAWLSSLAGKRPAESQGLSGEQQFLDRKSTRLNSSHSGESRMPSSA